MKLKPFEQIDYDSYAGVESVEPLISIESITVQGEEFTWHGDAIIDGKTVQLQLATEDMERQVTLSKDFKSGYEAILGLHLAPQKSSVAYWINLGFEVI
jgi:hypothetical protein